MKKIKKRLDSIVGERYPQLARTHIQSLIMQGKVRINNVINTKPGTQVAEDAEIVVDAQEPRYVSRAGFKLEKALEHFGVDVQGLIIADAGISTGGFTDCLLQKGAAKVYGIDVGYGHLHEKIRHDHRVVVMERTNLRELRSLGEQIDLMTLDLSFISVLKVMDAVCSLLKRDGSLIVLIKPQFEAGRQDIGRGGIIKDSAVHERVVREVVGGIEKHGFVTQGVIESPILGTEGNKEFLAYFKRTCQTE